MFSSNEKISGRQAFRLLVFDLLGLGTLLIPAAVAGFCGRDGIFCIIVGTVLGLLFLRLLVYAVGDMQGSFAEYTENIPPVWSFRKMSRTFFPYILQSCPAYPPLHTPEGGIFSVSDAVSRVYGVSVFCDGVKQPAAGGVFLSCTGADPWACLVWAVKRD